MNKEGYAILNPEKNVFHFVSTGHKGQILKLVLFQPIGKNLYNLVLADYDQEKNNWSDMSNSNNGDLPKVLSTVVHISHYFLTANPESIVYLEANTPSKNILYNRIIYNNIQDISAHFTIWGNKDGEQAPFELGILYDSFYIYLK